jgi:hypothetical protein
LQVPKPDHKSHSIPACQAAKIALQNKTIEIIESKILLKFIVIIKGIDAIIKAKYHAHLCFKQRSQASNPIISII